MRCECIYIYIYSLYTYCIWGYIIYHICACPDGPSSPVVSLIYRTYRRLANLYLTQVTCFKGRRVSLGTRLESLIRKLNAFTAASYLYEQLFACLAIQISRERRQQCTMVGSEWVCIQALYWVVTKRSVVIWWSSWVANVIYYWQQ